MKKLNNTWSAYLIELLVVFLGVSASFVLMNISENKADKNEELKYIEGFTTDIQENISQLKEEITNDSTWLANHTYAVQLIMDGELSFDSACSIVQAMAYFSKFEQQNTTYLNVVNSGNLGLLQDYILRHKIISYYSDLNGAVLLEEYFHGHNQSNFIPYMIKHYNMFTRILTDKDGNHSNEFKNLFGIHFSFTQQRLASHRDLLEKSYEMIELLGQ